MSSALADAVITELARLQSLIVRPSSVIAKYQGTEIDEREVGRELESSRRIDREIYQRRRTDARDGSTIGRDQRRDTYGATGLTLKEKIFSRSRM